MKPLLFRALAALLRAHFRRGDWPSAQRSGARLGDWAWRLSRRDRRRALAHLAQALPEIDGPGREELTRRVFQHLGRTLGESLWVLDHGPEEFLQRVSLTGWEQVERARAARRPILVLTGHCGNWELIGPPFARRGLPLAAIARRLDDPGLDALLLALRSRLGTHTIQRGAAGAPRELLRVMRGGGGLAMLIDQDTRVDGVWVPFFGRPAFTPVGAAELAARFHAAVIPTFIARLDDGSHRIEVQSILELPDDVVAATAMMTAAIEAHIRRCPDQWVWFHRRWRSQPPTSVAADGGTIPALP